MSVGVGRIFKTVCLSVCLFVRSITQNRMIPVFKLGIGYVLGISYKWHGFGLKGQRSTLRLTAIRRDSNSMSAFYLIAVIYTITIVYNVSQLYSWHGDNCPFSSLCLMPIKLEWLGYRMVEKLWRYVKPFSYNTSVSRTDRRTKLLYQYRASAAVCWRAIKIDWHWHSRNHDSQS